MVDLSILLKTEISQAIDNVRVSAVNFLSPCLALVIVDEVGLLLFHLAYQFKLPSLSKALIQFPEDQSAYFSGPLTYPDMKGKRDVRPVDTNAIRLYYSDFYLDARKIDSSLTRVATLPYFEAWLTRNITNYSWNVNFFNYLSSNHSKEIQSIPVVDQADCVQVYWDHVNSRSPKQLSFLIFCISFQQEALLWRY